MTDEERYTEELTAVRFERLTNSKSGNPRWEIKDRGGKFRRTQSDAQAGLDLTDIADKIDGDRDRHGRVTLFRPATLVLTCDKFGAVLRVALAEVEKR